MTETLTSAVQHIQRSEWNRRPMRTVMVRPRHTWNLRDVEVVTPFSARVTAHMHAYESGHLKRLVTAAQRSERIAREVAGTSTAPSKTVVAHAVQEHLEGLAERYFVLRPQQKGVSRRLIADLIADYEALLASETHVVTVIFPLTGAEGRVREFIFEPGVVVRQLRSTELQRLWAIQQEQDYYFSTADVREWNYCIATEVEMPRTQRPNAWVSWPKVASAITALRMGTDGRIGLSIGWLVPTPRALIDVSDRIVRPGGRIEDALRVVLTRPNLAVALRMYRLFQGTKINGSLAAAMRRYNFAVERDYLLDQLVDCWIGLETLYASDLEGELSYRICVRAASFLHPPGVERNAAFAVLRDSYRVRSKIVHGGDPPDDLRDTCERTQALLRESIVAWLDPKRDHTLQALDGAVLSGGG